MCVIEQMQTETVEVSLLGILHSRRSLSGCPGRRREMSANLSDSLVKRRKKSQERRLLRRVDYRRGESSPVQLGALFGRLDGLERRQEIT
jgi:hypothetical protein